MKSLIILGRQPKIGIAELESLYGSEPITVIGRGGVLIDGDVDFTRLGGSVKSAKVIDTINSTKWTDVEHYLSDKFIKHILGMPEGKIRLGLSAYGLGVRAPQINATGLKLKKIIKQNNRSIRVVPNKQSELNSAQIIHNKLTDHTGIEIVAARYDSKTVLAITINEQAIEDYAARDQGRPARDAKVGMLPPKLAQIIINLAVGNSSLPLTVLDPFCGTGVVLQEAHLMGYGLYGTDIDSRMIDYTKKNLDWLSSQAVAKLETGDATRHNWSNFDAVACETYLGKPLTSLPSRDILDKIMAECDEIHQKFLANIGSQIKPGTKLCLAVPAWRTKNGFLHLKTLDLLDELGYTRKKFVHVRDEELIYHRPDQTVARELVVLEKSN